MYRRVVYNKGTVMLAGLHARVGTPIFYRILTTTAARHVRTTTAFVELVGEVASPDARAWLRAELRR